MAYLSPIIPCLDLTYTYQPIAPRINRGAPNPNPGTAWDFICRESNNLGLMRALIGKSGLAGILNDTEASFTIFLPQDEQLLKHMTPGQILNMTKSEAYAIVNYSILTRRYNRDVLESSTCLRLITRRNTVRLNSSFSEGKLLLDQRVEVLSQGLLANNRDHLPHLRASHPVRAPAGGEMELRSPTGSPRQKPNFRCAAAVNWTQ